MTLSLRCGEMRARKGRKEKKRAGEREREKKSGRYRNSVALPFRLVRFAGKQHATDRTQHKHAESDARARTRLYIRRWLQVG